MEVSPAALIFLHLVEACAKLVQYGFCRTGMREQDWVSVSGSVAYIPVEKRRR
jgi:hypothetical protein